MHGEQGALVCTAKIVETVPWIDAKYYASTQVMDEARHVEVFAKYLDDKLSGHYPINAHLKLLLDDIVNDSRWDMTYLGMQIMVEGLALAAFGFIHQLTTEPLLKQLLRYVMSDEARHVAFGVLSLKEYYAELSDAELRERQEFAFEAAVRMRDRFLQQEVWERMGLDVKTGPAAGHARAAAAAVPVDAVLEDRARTARSSACSTPTTAGCAASSPSSASSASRTTPTPARSTRCSSWPRARWPADSGGRRPPPRRTSAAVDGIHDMGGMHGFGRVEPEVPDEPVFHAPWEGRTLGLMIATGGPGLRDGSIRPAIEEIDPATYLASSYYERWARAVEALVVAGGSLTHAEIDERAAVGRRRTRALRRHRSRPGGDGARLPRRAPRAVGRAASRARFAVGDRVTVARMAPDGHHRCPRYVRGVDRRGGAAPGGWPPPGDERATPRRRYTVRFAMRDLWGDDAEPGHLFIDLWERYLS